VAGTLVAPLAPDGADGVGLDAASRGLQANPIANARASETAAAAERGRREPCGAAESTR
jgi:hypothetical protein